MSIMALLLVMPAITVLATTPNSTGATNPTDATYPGSTYYTAFVDSGTPTNGITDTFTIPAGSPVLVDIGVNDLFYIGDIYAVTLNGLPIFTTTSVPIPTVDTFCYGTGGATGTCATEQAAGDIVDTGYSGCDLATAASDGLSVGDTTLLLYPGTYTITITDITLPTTTAVDSSFSGAGFCLTLGAPPSYSTPQFPLGLAPLIGISALGLILARKRITGIKRAVI